jgi:hypothetical protein
MAGSTAPLAPDLKQARRDPAQGLPDSAARLSPGRSEITRLKIPWARGITGEQYAMKLFMGWAVCAGLVFTAAAANAEVLAPAGMGPVTRVSDVGYAAMPAEAPPPGYGPRLLPPLEVYTIVRESGFSPLGIPQQRGLVYTISVIDRGGDDGRLVIDARSGRIIRFMPAYRMGDNFNEDLNHAYGPVGPLPPPTNSSYRRAPRPPLPIPHVARRSATPLPKAPPAAAKPAAPPAQQSATAKPAEVTAAPSSTVGVAKPSVQIMPTQEMPKAQGLD